MEAYDAKACQGSCKQAGCIPPIHFHAEVASEVAGHMSAYKPSTFLSLLLITVLTSTVAVTTAIILIIPLFFIPSESYELQSKLLKGCNMGENLGKHYKAY